LSVKHDSDDDLCSDLDPTDDSLPILYIRQLRTPQTKKKRCDWTNHHYHHDGSCNCNRFLRPYTSPGDVSFQILKVIQVYDTESEFSF